MIVIVVYAAIPKKLTLKNTHTPKTGPPQLDGNNSKKFVTWADFYKKLCCPHPAGKQHSNRPTNLLLTSTESVEPISDVTEKTQTKKEKKKEDEAFKKKALQHRNKQEREKKHIQTHSYGAPKLASAKKLTAAVKSSKKINRRL